jgi:hypothetical protein
MQIMQNIKLPPANNETVPLGLIVVVLIDLGIQNHSDILKFYSINNIFINICINK